MNILKGRINIAAFLTTYDLGYIEYQHRKEINMHMKKQIKSKTCLLLAVTIILGLVAGCGKVEMNSGNTTESLSKYEPIISESKTESTKESKQAEDVVNEVVPEKSETAKAEIPERVADDAYYQLLDTTIQLDAENVQRIDEEIRQIKVDYEHSDLYEIEAAWKEYEKIQYVKYGEPKLIKNRKVDTNELYNLILQNSKEFVANNEFTYYDRDIDIDLIRKAANVIAENINLRLKKNTFIDVGELDKKLSHLIVLTYTGFGSGMYDDGKNILSLNMKMIATQQKQRPEVDAFEMIAKHESNHLVQAFFRGEDENESLDYCIGFCYSFNDVDINSLNYTTIYEACSEMLVLNDYNDGREPMVYYFWIKRMESLVLTNILKDNVTPISLEELTCQHDLDLFLEQFNIADKNDKLEILTMLYALELVNDGSEEFEEKYKQKTGERLTVSKENEYKDSLEESIAITLSKQFYLNLLACMEENQVSLEDVYQLISGFESEMNLLTGYASFKDINKDFVNEYQKIQTQFFELLSQELNVPVTDLTDAYVLYRKNMKNFKKIAWIDEDKNAFLEKMFISRINQKRESVVEVYER